MPCWNHQALVVERRVYNQRRLFIFWKWVEKTNKINKKQRGKDTSHSQCQEPKNKKMNKCVTIREFGE